MAAKIIASKVNRSDILGYKGFNGWKAKDPKGNVCIFLTLSNMEMTKSQEEMKTNRLSMPKALCIMDAVFSQNNFKINQSDKKDLLEKSIRLFIRKEEGRTFTEFGVERVKFVPKEDYAGRFIFKLAE